MSNNSVLQKYVDEIYFIVKLKLKFRDKILAGIPKNESVLDYFMNARHMSDPEKEDFVLRVKTGSLSEEEKAEIKETAWCMFEKDKDGNLCLWHGNCKAMLREIFVTLGLTQKAPKKRNSSENKEGAAGGRQTLQHAVHVDGFWADKEGKIDYRSFGSLRLLFERNGKVIKEPDGYVDKIKHITDAAGKRSALGRHDFLEQVELSLVLKWPNDGVFSEDDMKKALSVAQDDGCGATRSQGNGKFDVIEWEVLSQPRKKVSSTGKKEELEKQEVEAR